MSTNIVECADAQLAMLFDRLVRQIHVRLREKAPEFDTENIGPGGAMVLLTLNDEGSLPMAALARSQVRDKSQMTRVIASLERKGLVERLSSESDNRVVTVALTGKGQDVVAVHQGAISNAIDGALEPLTLSERGLLKGLLQKALGAR